MDGKAQMIAGCKEDQILQAFQIMTREGRRMQMKTISDPENPELVTVGNKMDASHIPPGYNRKILAPDVEGKAQMIAGC